MSENPTPTMSPSDLAVFREIYDANHEFGLPYLPDVHHWTVASRMESVGFLEAPEQFAPATEGAKGYVVTRDGMRAYNSAIELAQRPAVDPGAPPVIELTGAAPNLAGLGDPFTTMTSDREIVAILEIWERSLRAKRSFGLVATHNPERLIKIADEHRSSIAFGHGGRLFFAARLNAFNWEDVLSRVAESRIPRLAAVIDNGLDAMDLTSVEHVHCTAEIPEGSPGDPPAEEKSWGLNALEGKAWVHWYDGSDNTNPLQWVIASETAIKDSAGAGLERLRFSCEDEQVPLLIVGALFEPVAWPDVFRDRLKDVGYAQQSAPAPTTGLRM